jgi:hypothetical protein
MSGRTKVLATNRTKGEIQDPYRPIIKNPISIKICGYGINSISKYEIKSQTYSLYFRLLKRLYTSHVFLLLESP